MTRDELRRLASMAVEKLDASPKKRETYRVESVFRDTSFLTRQAAQTQQTETKENEK